MRRIIYIIFFLSSVCLLFAEELSDGRNILSMEDAILNKSLNPENYDMRWDKDYVKEYLLNCDSVWYAVNIRTGKKRTIEAPDYSVSTRNCPVLRDNNIVWIDADSVEYKVTDFADKNIVCGQAVSRNEFGIMGGLFMSPDNSRLAFYQKDESLVTDFPLLDITSRTGTLMNLKYPMNGMPSERVSVGVFDVNTKSTVYLKVNDFSEERYLTNLTWSPDSKRIYLQIVSRSQKDMHLNVYDAINGAFIETLLTEHDDRYVEPEHPLYFLDDDRFIYTCDVRDGYNSLYLYTLSTKTIKRLTNVSADVEYVAHDAKSVYYYSSEVSPAERHLFKVDIRTGKSFQLTRAEGWHCCDVSADGRYFYDNYSSVGVPRIVAVGSTDGRFYREVFKADDPAREYNYAPIEFGSLKSADGRYDNHYRLIRPLDFDSTKQYPVILYVYGGPHSQLVTNSYNALLRRWEMYMAQRGYVVFVMDNRGTLSHGSDYRRAMHRQCGKVEMEDQMVGMRWLMSHHWVDKDRIGVHGWSYGGFMTISLMVNYPEVFKVAVAGGPVIDWKWYEIMYGERYMETQATNPEGFEQVSLLSKAKNLKGKLLICQGAVDNIVVWQHSLNFIDECIKANVQVDYFPYPRSQHNVIGKDRVHLMQKVTDYFDDFLK